VYLTSGDGEDGLGWLLHAQDTVHDQEHDDGQQSREHCAQQVVRAAVLGDGHHLSNHVADKVHPRDGRAERKAGDDKVGRLAGKLGGDLGNAHLYYFFRKKVVTHRLGRKAPPGRSWHT